MKVTYLDAGIVKQKQQRDMLCACMFQFKVTHEPVKLHYTGYSKFPETTNYLAVMKKGVGTMFKEL